MKFIPENFISYNEIAAANNQGWRCPVCGKCYSPTTPMCFYCGNKEGTAQSTGTSINDDEWWRKYLKKNMTSQPVNDNPSTTSGEEYE